MKTAEKTLERIYRLPFAAVYAHYVTKIERKGRTKDELHEVIRWLTGFDHVAIARHLADETTLEDFFDASALHPNSTLITGVICGVRVENIEEPVMQQVRYLDKLV